MSSFSENTESSSESLKSNNVIMKDFNGLEPPFPKDIHLLSPEPTAEQYAILEDMKAKIQDHPLFSRNIDFLTDLQFRRFLIARNYNLDAAIKLCNEALEWREKRKPYEMLTNMEEWNNYLSKENETGKIYCPGKDRWGRSLVVFFNEAQNTKDPEAHMNFLAWNLELASQTLDEEVTDKYLIFCNLSEFSVWSAPTWKETIETIQMLTTCFPERLGHFICYQPPLYFKTIFPACKPFLDAKTVSKIIFLSGSVEDGSENDVYMKQIIGDDWKVKTGADQPVLQPNSSPGYDHKTYWPTVHERIEEIKSRNSSRASSRNTSEKIKNG